MSALHVGCSAYNVSTGASCQVSGSGATCWIVCRKGFESKSAAGRESGPFSQSKLRPGQKRGGFRGDSSGPALAFYTKPVFQLKTQFVKTRLLCAFMGPIGVTRVQLCSAHTT